jgi:SAM-dependent methyltransferase
MDQNNDNSRLSTGTQYIFDNSAQQASARFPALSAAFDPGTIRHLEKLGVFPGWHCLEVGGGGGSVASWLATRVAPTGHVVVTDIDPRFLASLNLPHTEVRQHDISKDPLPEAAFDLIHSRLVLMHIPEREKALARMISALKPGGWLIDEEFDCSVFPDPTIGSGEVLLKTHIAMTKISDERGIDRKFGRRVFGILKALGLADLQAEGRTFLWPTRSPGTSLMRTNYEQLRSAMIASGYATGEEIDEDITRLDDPEFLMPSPILWAVWGRRA